MESAKERYIKLDSSLRVVLEMEYGDDWEYIYYTLFKCNLPLLRKGPLFRRASVYKSQFDKLLQGMQVIAVDDIGAVLPLYVNEPVQFMFVLQSFSLKVKQTCINLTKEKIIAQMEICKADLGGTNEFR